MSCKADHQGNKVKQYFSVGYKQLSKIYVLTSYLQLDLDPYLAFFLVMTCDLSRGHSDLVRMDSKTTKQKKKHDERTFYSYNDRRPLDRIDEQIEYSHQMIYVYSFLCLLTSIILSYMDHCLVTPCLLVTISTNLCLLMHVSLLSVF